MIVAVSRIPLPKTERYLCWVRVAMQDNPNLRPIGHGFGFIVFIKDIEV